jgi:hypothetical protein
LRAMFLTKLKTVALMLLAVGILGSGAGLLTHQALADGNEKSQTAEGKRPPARAQEEVPPNRDTPGRAEEDDLAVAEEDKEPAVQDKGEAKSDSPLPPISGTVVRVDKDGKGLGLEIPSKEGEARTVDIKIPEKTRPVFSNVGPDEARLTEGYRADVWLEKDSKDVAARLHLSGKRTLAASAPNQKISPPHRTGRVVAVAADGKGFTLEKLSKGERPAEKITIQCTDETRVFFFNVARGGARTAAGYEARVWLEDNSPDVARGVSFFGTAEEKPAEGKGQKPDHSGRVVSVSGKVLTVERTPAKGEEAAKTEIKLTDATRESYNGVPPDGAKPVAGYVVQVWLAEGSQDTAARVRFSRKDPRKGVDARVLTVSADGSRFTVEIATKGGEPIKREIKIAAQTRLVYFNVGPGGARLTSGYHVRGWLAEGSEDTADELMVSPSEKTDDKKPADKKPGGQKPA